MGYQLVKPHGHSFVLFCFVPLSFGDITNLEKRIQKQNLVKIYIKNNPPIFFAKKQQNCSNSKS
jgi:hypothetical protein